ncbi:MAG: glycoside hydrolase family 3 N-terminal domain-containing protein [Gemmatimonadota bacterium]
MKVTLPLARLFWAAGPLCLGALAGCTTGGAGGRNPAAADPATHPPVAAEADTLGPPPTLGEPGVVGDTLTREPPPVFDSLADSVLSTLTLEEKAGQLLMPWVLGDFAPDGSASRERIVEMVTDMEVGGIIVSVGSPTEVAVKLNQAQRDAKIPLLVAADLETGAGFRFRGAAYLPGPISLGGATEFPSLMALGATGDEALAEAMGRVTGLEARALGVHVPFAPVLDVNNNPDNPIINIRSFGEDPEVVARLGAAFVRGVQGAGGIATGKHFPGHGDTKTDSHLDLPFINVPRERLDRVELPPFQAAIDGGIGGIMTAHLSIPALTGDDGEVSTLSPKVITGLLREEMGFGGLIFTDAMDMNAIDRWYGREEAAVRALEAGVDVLLMPPSPEAARQGIVSAVLAGRLSEDRLNASVLRVLSAKEGLGLHRNREVPVEEVARRVGIREHEEVAQEVADRSMTLLKNEKNLLPLLGTRTARVLSVTLRGPTDLMAGRVVNTGLRSRYPRLETATLDRDTRADVYSALLTRARSTNLVVVSLFVRILSSSGSVAIPAETVKFIQALAREDIPHVVISFGNPYLLAEFPNAQAYLLAWSGADVSQRATVRALFGEIEIQGRTPTRIPPHFEIGDGIHVPVRQGRRDL